MIFIFHKCSKITLCRSPVFYIFSSLQRKKLGFLCRAKCLSNVCLGSISAVNSELSHEINKLLQKKKKGSVLLAGINSI